MTEQEWWEGTVPYPLIVFLFHDQLVPDRKLRLFSCAAARRVERYAGDEVFSRLLRAADDFSEEKVEYDILSELVSECYRCRQRLCKSELPHEVLGACDAILACADRSDDRRRESYQPFDLYMAYPLTASLRSCNAAHYAGEHPVEEEYQIHVKLLHDIFGNPFRPVTINAAWETPAVVSLAYAAYDRHIMPAETLEPDRLAVLADALEDAGCDNADILNHCRQPGEHVRGCWVLDLLLGKE
jgi:hypothetical protein